MPDNIHETQISNDPFIDGIKKAIEERFGTVVDTETGKKEKRKFEDINLNGHCGDVSRITNSLIKGTVKEKQVAGHNPQIIYKGEKSFEIASGFNIAIHSYVVDKDNRIWDPITGNWGDTTEEKYLDKLESMPSVG